MDRETIINKLKKTLEPLPFIYAFWLEGADAVGRVDEYSDLDFWVDCDDAYEDAATNAVENALSELAYIDYKYIIRHSHPKIRHRVYHLAGTSEYLMIDFCWQMHSRAKDESAFYENDNIEAVKVIFDKDNIIRYKPFNAADLYKQNTQQLEEAVYRRSQHMRVIKYVHRNQYLEAYAYYNKYALEPLIDILRIIYTPAHAGYYLIHISHHIPQIKKEKLEYFAQICSIQDIALKLPQAAKWFDELMGVLEEKC